MVSVVQGFVKPWGYEGKGMEGQGQGREIVTLLKPLPLLRGGLYPSCLPVGSCAGSISIFRSQGPCKAHPYIAEFGRKHFAQMRAIFNIPDLRSLFR